ncbi:hypothetical protein CLOL250_01730 [Clostridium sp. L2-50]|nr:hypothetical protein CLOL250_01730 [Clostridium sp. L2-50]
MVKLIYVIYQMVDNRGLNKRKAKIMVVHSSTFLL